MNSSSELETDWSRLPDQYEVEITESHRLSNASFNDTNNNATLTFQGERISGRAFGFYFAGADIHPCEGFFPLSRGRLIFQLLNMIPKATATIRDNQLCQDVMKNIVKVYKQRFKVRCWIIRTNMKIDSF